MKSLLGSFPPDHQGGRQIGTSSAGSHVRPGLHETTHRRHLGHLPIRHGQALSLVYHPHRGTQSTWGVLACLRTLAHLQDNVPAFPPWPQDASLDPRYRQVPASPTNRHGHPHSGHRPRSPRASHISPRLTVTCKAAQRASYPSSTGPDALNHVLCERDRLAGAPRLFHERRNSFKVLRE